MKILSQASAENIIETLIATTAVGRSQRMTVSVVRNEPSASIKLARRFPEEMPNPGKCRIFVIPTHIMYLITTQPIDQFTFYKLDIL